MKFEYEGQEYDTDKPIYVLGTQRSSGCWFAESAIDVSETLKDLANYGVKLKTKKMYVSELRFQNFLGSNYVKNNVVQMFLVTPRRDDDAWIKKGDNKVIGHSPQECLKIYRERLEVVE